MIAQAFGPDHNAGRVTRIVMIFYRFTGPLLKGAVGALNHPRHRSFLCEMACMLNATKQFPMDQLSWEGWQHDNRGEVRYVLYGNTSGLRTAAAAARAPLTQDCESVTWRRPAHCRLLEQSLRQTSESGRGQPP